MCDAVGFHPDATVDVSVYGPGPQVLPTACIAWIGAVGEALLADSDTPVTDEIVFRQLDWTRR
jgi:hypothetical protein